MSEQIPQDDLKANMSAVDAAVNRASREAVLRSARLGFPVCTWRDGKVVWLQPAEIFALLGVEEGKRPEPSQPPTIPSHRETQKEYLELREEE